MAHNPFILLSPELLEAMVKVPKLIVRQYYPRGGDSGKGKPLLLTYYYKDHHIEVSRANLHLKQLKDDPCRFLYDTENETHLAKLRVAARQPAGFRIYVNLAWRRWEPTPELKRKINGYMEQHFPSWRPDPRQKLRVQMQDLYGKFYLHLSWKGNKAEVLLDDVEKY